MSHVYSFAGFGCLCYVHTHDNICNKFDAWGTRSIFLGYSQGKKGWRVFDLKSQPIFGPRDVIFHEDIYLFAQSSDEQPDPQISTSLETSLTHLLNLMSLLVSPILLFLSVHLPPAQ